MTGPAARGTERGTRAPSRVTGTQGAVGAVLVVLALGLALRLIIAYLLPGSGFGVDLGAFRAWAANLASQGLNGFYQRDFFHDYTPGYLYVLWVLGLVGQALGGVGVALIKVPAILADLAIGWLVWSMVLELGGRRKVALVAAFVAVVNPISWFDSVVWGQVDSVGVVFLLLGLRELWRDHPERSADLRGGGRADQAAARDPDPDPGAGHDPAGALAGREDGRRSRRWPTSGRVRRTTAGSPASAPGSGAPTIRSASSRPA